MKETNTAGRSGTHDEALTARAVRKVNIPQGDEGADG